MSLTGVIYGGIVVLWLCYLVPLALRRYDDATRARSVERFATAMRGLGRADAVESLIRGRTLAIPAADAESLEWVDPRAQQQAARLAARRRRRVLAVLVFGTAGTAVVCLLALAPWWSMSIPAGLTIAFLVVARVQVARTRTRTWESALVTGGQEPTGDAPDEEPTVVLDAIAERLDLPPQQLVAASVPTDAGGSLWHPVPVTLPTYVSKPAAPPRQVAPLDLPDPPEPDVELAGEQAEPAPARAVGD